MVQGTPGWIVRHVSARELGAGRQFRAGLSAVSGGMSAVTQPGPEYAGWSGSVPGQPPMPYGATPLSAPPLAVPVQGAVQAAVIVTWTSCAIAVAGAFALTVLAAFMGTMMLPYFERTQRVQMVAFVAASVAFVVAACAIASVSAWFVWRRRRWARVVLAVCSALAALCSLVVLTPPTMLILPGAIAVLVLLFLPQSNAWFRARAAG